MIEASRPASRVTELCAQSGSGPREEGSHRDNDDFGGPTAGTPKTDPRDAARALLIERTRFARDASAIRVLTEHATTVRHVCAAQFSSVFGHDMYWIVEVVIGKDGWYAGRRGDASRPHPPVPINWSSAHRDDVRRLLENLGRASPPARGRVLWPEALGLGALLGLAALLHVLARPASRQPHGRHRWAILVLLAIWTSAILIAGRATGNPGIGAVGVLTVLILWPLRW